MVLKPLLSGLTQELFALKDSLHPYYILTIYLRVDTVHWDITLNEFIELDMIRSLFETGSVMDYVK